MCSDHHHELQRLDALLHRHHHHLHIQPLPGELATWLLRLTHRTGLPVIGIETDSLAFGVGVLLHAADTGTFWDEPAAWEQP